tara:strand:- start:783 stop:5264 length:4482 start_codon:yes stop_codon:yes gene_type:complete
MSKEGSPLKLNASNLQFLGSTTSTNSPNRSIQIPQIFKDAVKELEQDMELTFKPVSMGQDDRIRNFWNDLPSFKNDFENMPTKHDMTIMYKDDLVTHLKGPYGKWNSNNGAYIPQTVHSEYSNVSAMAPSDGIGQPSQAATSTNQWQIRQYNALNNKVTVKNTLNNYITKLKNPDSVKDLAESIKSVKKRKNKKKQKTVQNIEHPIEHIKDQILTTYSYYIEQDKGNLNSLFEIKEDNYSDEETNDCNDKNVCVILFNDKNFISLNELDDFDVSSESKSDEEDMDTSSTNEFGNEVEFKIIKYIIHYICLSKKDQENDKLIKELIYNTKLFVDNTELTNFILELLSAELKLDHISKDETIEYIREIYKNNNNNLMEVINEESVEKEKEEPVEKEKEKPVEKEKEESVKPAMPKPFPYSKIGTIEDTNYNDTSKETGKERSSSISVYDNNNIKEKPSWFSAQQQEEEITENQEGIEDLFLAFEDDEKYKELDKDQENQAVADAVEYYIEEQFNDYGDVKEEQFNDDGDVNSNNPILDGLIEDNKDNIKSFIDNDNNNIISIIKESIDEARDIDPSTDLGGSVNNTKIVGGDTELEEKAFGPYIEQTIAVLNGDIAKETIIDVNDYDDLDNDDDENKTPLIHDERSLIDIIDSKDNDIFKSTEDKYTLEDEPEVEETDKFISPTDQKDEFKKNIKKNIETIIEESDNDIREYSVSDVDIKPLDDNYRTKKDKLIDDSYKKTLQKIKASMDEFKERIGNTTGSVRSSTTGALTHSAKPQHKQYKVVHNIATSYLSNVLNNSNLSLDEINTAGTTRSDGRNALVQSVFSHMLGGANIKFNGSTFREDMARASTGVRSLGANNRQQMINCWGKRVTYITERFYENIDSFNKINVNNITSAKDKNIFKITFATHQISKLKPKCYICGCDITENHYPEVEHKLPCVGFYSQIYNIAAYPNLKKYWNSFIDNTKYDKYGLFTMLVKLYKYMHIHFNENKITDYFGGIFSLFEKYLKKNTKFYVIGNKTRNEKDLDHFKLILLPYLSEFTWSHHTCNQIKTNYDLINDKSKFMLQMKNLLEGRQFKGAVIKKNMVDAESDAIKTINFEDFNKRYDDNLSPQIEYLNKQITEFAGKQDLTKKRLFIRTLKRIYITQKNDNKDAVQASKNRANFQMKLIKKTVVQLKKMVAGACNEIVNFTKYSLNQDSISARTSSGNDYIPLKQIIKDKLLLPFLYIFKGDAFGKVYDSNNNEITDTTNNGCIKEGLVLLNKTINILNKTALKRIDNNKKICLKLIIILLMKMLLKTDGQKKEFDPNRDYLFSSKLDLSNDLDNNAYKLVETDNSYIRQLFDEFFVVKDEDNLNLKITTKSLLKSDEKDTDIILLKNFKINIIKDDTIEIDYDGDEVHLEGRLKNPLPGRYLNDLIYKKDDNTSYYKELQELDGKNKFNVLKSLKEAPIEGGRKKKRKNNSKRKRRTIKKNKKKNTKKKYKNRKKYTRKHIKK